MRGFPLLCLSVLFLFWLPACGPPPAKKPKVKPPPAVRKDFWWLLKSKQYLAIEAALNKGVSPNLVHPTTRMTPIGYAAQEEDGALTSLLLTHGANVTLQTGRLFHDENPDLSYPPEAVCAKSKTMCLPLWQLGMRLGKETWVLSYWEQNHRTWRDQEGFWEDAFIWLSKLGDKEGLNRLLAKAGPQWLPFAKKQTLLAGFYFYEREDRPDWNAAVRGDAAAWKKALPTATPDVFFAVAAQGNQILAKDLLDRKISPNQVWPSTGDTPLLAAVRAGQLDMVGFLITKGAKIHVFNKNGESPMTLALASGDVNQIRFLFDHSDDDMNQKDPLKGETILFQVARVGDKVAAEALFRGEVWADIRNKNNQQAWEVAEQSGNWWMVKDLQDRAKNSASVLEIKPPEEEVNPLLRP